MSLRRRSIIYSGALPTLTYLANSTQNTQAGNPNTVTYTGISLGAAQSDRAIIVTVDYVAISLSSVTIAGIAATLVASATSSSTSASIWIALVPTGTSGNIVLSGSQIALSGIGVYSATGLLSLTPFDTSTDTVRPITMSLNVPALGLVVGTACNNGGSANWVWSDLSSDFANQFPGGVNAGYSAASLTATAAITPQGVNPTNTGGFAAGAVASFR